MAEDNNTNTYGAVNSTQPVNEDKPEERVRSVDSFYEDQTIETKDHRIISDTTAVKMQLHEEEQKERLKTESCLLPDIVKNQLNANDTAAEKLPRPTRVSFSKEQPTTPTHGAISPSSARHVSFTDEASQNETGDSGVAYDNCGFSDIQSSVDSITRVRAITNCSVHYQTHSEAEECNESEISLALNFHQNSQTTTTPRRRGLRRRYTRHGTIVTDSFVNECICCCTII